MTIVKLYKENFLEEFRSDKGSRLLNLLNESKLNTEKIYDKIKQIQDKEEEIANRKIISLINYSNYQISEKKTITTYKRSYILFIFTIFFITIFVLYLILRKENEFFFQFFKRITGINKLILRSIIKNHPNIKKEEIIYLTNIPQEEINSFIKKIKLQEQK